MTASVAESQPGQPASRQRRLFWISLGAVVALLAVALADWVFPQQVLTVDSGPVKADVMVVLGGGSQERSERAVELFNQGVAPKILVSGSGDCLSNEMLLEKAGVPEKAITLECSSRSTRENAKKTVAMLRAQHLQSAVIVTDWYHSRRALACFEHYAPDIKFYSRPSYHAYSRTEWRSNGINSYIKSEYLKLLGYWVCYGVCPL